MAAGGRIQKSGQVAVSGATTLYTVSAGCVLYLDYVQFVPAAALGASGRLELLVDGTIMANVTVVSGSLLLALSKPLIAASSIALQSTAVGTFYWALAGDEV